MLARVEILPFITTISQTFNFAYWAWISPIRRSSPMALLRR